VTELVLLKLGGSVITDKNQPFTAREQVIRRLGQEIRQAVDGQPGMRLILGHGSGSFGHMVAHRYRTHEGAIQENSWQGFAETAMAAARLNRLVTDLLFQEGVPVVSFQPSASARCRRGDLIHLDIEPMKLVLEAGLFPVVYGDVALDETKGFTIISTEQIFDHITCALHPCRIVLVGIVDGVYDADPLTHPEAVHYQEITPRNWHQVQARLGGSHATDVTGGMLSKVHRMMQLALAHPTLRIRLVSGEIPGRVAAVLSGNQGDVGTLLCHHSPQP